MSLYKHTKKVGVAGKFGARVGRRLREEYKKVHEAKLESTCPDCGANKLKRKNIGIWICKKCGLEFTSRAYSVGTIKETKINKNDDETLFSSDIRKEETDEEESIQEKNIVKNEEDDATAKQEKEKEEIDEFIIVENEDEVSKIKEEIGRNKK